jgi:hypothetical protein
MDTFSDPVYCFSGFSLASRNTGSSFSPFRDEKENVMQQKEV